MSFLDLVRKRQSDRGYTDCPVGRESIGRCLEAARLAPSAYNSQPWFFVVVDEPGLRAQVAGQCRDLVMNHFVDTAPVLVAVVAETPPLIPRLAGHLKDKQYYLMDIGIAAEHFCLQAAEEHLGTCIIGWFNEKGLKRLLRIPKGKRIALVIALGHPKDTTVRAKLRKELSEISRYNG
jgi:nitroreductase